MVFVAVNALSVPEGEGETLERRFGGRAGLVEGSEGFVSFELWRPNSGTTDYLVVTRWESEDFYQKWLQSRQFAAGHGDSRGGGDSTRSPAAAGSQIWLFTAVQSVYAGENEPQ